MRLGGVARLVTVVVTMVTDQTNVHRGKEREDQGLDEADKQLHEIEHKEKSGAVQEVFTAENVSEKPDRKRHRANHDRNHFDQTHGEEYQREYIVERGGCFLFVGLITKQIEKQ